jgi:putative oxidoreductase
MKILVIIVRIALGLLLLVSGLGYFFKLMPQPQLPENAQSFISGLFSSGYLLPLVKVVEIATGIAFFVNRFVPAATVVIFPITLNIFLFHTILAPEGLLMGVLVLVANLFLAFTFRKNYTTVLAIR